MEILVAILIIALIAAVAFALMQRRPIGGRGLSRPRTSPLDRPRRRVSRRDPMAAAVADHAEATHPDDVIVAEQRMRAEARHIADGLNAESTRVEHQRAQEQVTHADTEPYADPAYAVPPPEASRDPEIDPRTHPYDDPATDPRYNDRRYQGRLAGDYVDPHQDER
jgi:hypothetical protein